MREDSQSSSNNGYSPDTSSNWAQLYPDANTIFMRSGDDANPMVGATYRPLFDLDNMPFIPQGPMTNDIPTSFTGDAFLPAHDNLLEFEPAQPAFVHGIPHGIDVDPAHWAAHGMPLAAQNDGGAYYAPLENDGDAAEPPENCAHAQLYDAVHAPPFDAGGGTVGLYHDGVAHWQQPLPAQNDWPAHDGPNIFSAHPPWGYDAGDVHRYHAGNTNPLSLQSDVAAMNWGPPAGDTQSRPPGSHATAAGAMEYEERLAPPRSSGGAARTAAPRRPAQRGRGPSEAPALPREDAGASAPFEYIQYEFVPYIPPDAAYPGGSPGLGEGAECERDATPMEPVRASASDEQRRGKKRARADNEETPVTARKMRKTGGRASAPAQQVQTTVVDDPKFKGNIARVVSAYASAEDPPTADVPVAGPSNLGLHVQENNNYLARRVHSTGTRLAGRLQLWDGPERARPTPEEGERFSVNEPRPVGHDLFCKTCHEICRVVYWQDRDKALKHVRLQHREGRAQRHEEERGAGSGSKRKKRQGNKTGGAKKGKGRDSNDG